jgi:hypothetical protein
MGDLRQTGRFQYTGKVLLSWMDRDGTSRSLSGECIDISEGGIRVRLRNPLDVRTYVSIKCPAANLHGSASVRSCVRERMAYIAGLQFTGGMKLSPSIALTAEASGTV